MPAERAVYPLRRYGRWLGMAASLAVALVIAWGSLSPTEQLPRDLPWDKLNHFVAYAALALTLGMAGLRPWRVAVLAIAYGVAIEFAQVTVPGRLGADPTDMLANALGAALGLGVLATARRVLPRRD